MRKGILLAICAAAWLLMPLSVYGQDPIKPVGPGVGIPKVERKLSGKILRGRDCSFIDPRVQLYEYWYIRSRSEPVPNLVLPNPSDNTRLWLTRQAELKQGREIGSASLDDEGKFTITWTVPRLTLSPRTPWREKVRLLPSSIDASTVDFDNLPSTTAYQVFHLVVTSVVEGGRDPVSMTPYPFIMLFDDIDVDIGTVNVYP